MANDGDIYHIKVIGNRDMAEFQAELLDRVNAYQSDGLHVDIQYQMIYEDKGPALGFGPLYSALVTARKYDDAEF